jgi:hypothetical protein
VQQLSNDEDFLPNTNHVPSLLKNQLSTSRSVKKKKKKKKKKRERK